MIIFSYALFALALYGMHLIYNELILKGESSKKEEFKFYDVFTLQTMFKNGYFLLFQRQFCNSGTITTLDRQLDNFWDS